jgi:hypothetical protein
MNIRQVAMNGHLIAHQGRFAVPLRYLPRSPFSSVVKDFSVAPRPRFNAAGSRDISDEIRSGI